MIRLSVKDLDTMKEICEVLGIDQFIVKQDGTNGIGTVLTLSFDTVVGKVADYKATMTVVINGVKDW
jgi:hypothetical protein